MIAFIDTSTSISLFVKAVTLMGADNWADERRYHLSAMGVPGEDDPNSARQITCKVWRMGYHDR